MPAYATTGLRYSMVPGQNSYSWGIRNSDNSETFEAMPANGVAGRSFALPKGVGRANQTRAIVWSTEFETLPAAVNIRLQGAMRDVDAEYVDVDTSTQVAGEVRSIAEVGAYNFLRVIVHSSSGGSVPGLIAKLCY